MGATQVSGSCPFATVDADKMSTSGSDSPRDSTPRTPRGAISKRQCNKRTIIFQINDPNGIPVYVGRSCQLSSRTAALERVATSQSKRLSSKLRQWDRTTYSFKANCHPIKGVRHGVPVKEGDKYKHYFMHHLNGKGTLHNHNLNPDGCNQKEANDAVNYDKFMDEIGEKLKKLEDDEDLFPPLGTTEHAEDMANNHRDMYRKVCDILEQDGNVPKDVQEAHTVAANVATEMERDNKIRDMFDSMKRKLHAQKEKFATDKKDGTTTQWKGIAKTLNSILDELNEAKPQDPRPPKTGTARKKEKAELTKSELKSYENYKMKQFSHDLLVTAIEQTRKLDGNGDVEGPVGKFNFYKGLHFVEVIDQLIESRDYAGYVPKKTVQGWLSWANPTGQLDRDLKARHDILKGQMDKDLHPISRASAVATLEQIKAKMREFKRSHETSRAAASSPHTEYTEEDENAYMSGRMSPASMADV